MSNKPIVIKESPVHLWFELTYSSYFVMPRLLLENMPHEWQKRFVKLIEQIPEHLKLHEDYTAQYSVQYKVNGKFASDPYVNYRRGTVEKKADH